MVRRRGGRYWPEWWGWPLEVSPHAVKRMKDRDFTEVDLRDMLEKAKIFRPDVMLGRWVVGTRWKRRMWEVIVEPDSAERLLVVITAYPLEPGEK